MIEILLKQSREMIFQLLRVAFLLWNRIASWRYMGNTHLLEKVLSFLAVLQSIGTMPNKMAEGSGQKKSMSCI